MQQNKKIGDTYGLLLRQAHRDGIERYSVDAIISNGTGILLVKRSSSDDFLSSRHELPGGGVDAGETVEGALRREIGEEVGLRIVSIGQCIGGFRYTSSSGQITQQFAFSVSVENFEVILSHEHSSHVFVPRQNLPRYDVTKETRGIIARFWNLQDQGHDLGTRYMPL